MTIKLDPLTSKALISDLKSLWKVQGDAEDEQALLLLEQRLAELSQPSPLQTRVLSEETCPEIDQEDFEIQKKVLAKTRLKTEELLKKVRTLEQAQNTTNPIT